MHALAIQPEEIAQRRAARAYRLAVVEIPVLRIIGSTCLSIGVLLNNRFILGQSSLMPWAVTTLALAIYSLMSWAITAFFFRSPRRIDLTTFFLVLDLVAWTGVIYSSGAENSWLFFIPLARVADQTQTTFRRCLTFALLGGLFFFLMALWVLLIDHRPVAWTPLLVKLVFLLLTGVYIAITARTAERRRAQMARSISMSRDLIRQMQEQSGDLHDARARAEEASAAKSEFVANMSHEMRTPLHGVIGMLELAIEEEDSPRRQRQLEMAKRSAESLLGTIEDILDFSKIEARKIDLEPVYFSLRDVVTETMKPLGVTAAAKGLVLSAGIAADVPDSVWGDPQRLRQILINLVGNAIKFTEAGEISVRVTRHIDQIRFEVSDTGIGIPEDEHDKIFAPFEQANNSRSRRFGGTGLGLAIVSQLVQAMGGWIEVKSEAGRGSTFSFVVSLIADAVGTAPPRAPWEKQLAGRAVLVVDRHAAARQITADMLRSRGMTVTECESAVEPPPGPFHCAVTTDEFVPVFPAVVITSPLEHVGDDRIRITRPVVERELIDAVGASMGLVRIPSFKQPSPPRTGMQALRVLVAEDNLVNQEFAAEALRRLGHRVSVASDGEEALRMMRREFFDVVLMDEQMPHLLGTDVTRQFRETEPRGIHVPIISLSANTSTEDRRRSIEAGMDAVLTKPIDVRQLQEVVRAVTGVEPIVEAVGGNVKLLERVSEAFAKQTPALLDEMRSAISGSNSDGLYRAAHTMKGAVSNFGADPSLDLSLMLEEAAKEKDFERAKLLLGRLESAVAALERRINSAVTK